MHTGFRKKRCNFLILRTTDARETTCIDTIGVFGKIQHIHQIVIFRIFLLKC